MPRFRFVFPKRVSTAAIGCAASAGGVPVIRSHRLAMPDRKSIYSSPLSWPVEPQGELSRPLPADQVRQRLRKQELTPRPPDS